MDTYFIKSHLDNPKTWLEHHHTLPEHVVNTKNSNCMLKVEFEQKSSHSHVTVIHSHKIKVEFSPSNMQHIECLRSSSLHKLIYHQ